MSTGKGGKPGDNLDTHHIKSQIQGRWVSRFCPGFPVGVQIFFPTGEFVPSIVGWSTGRLSPASGNADREDRKESPSTSLENRDANLFRDSSILTKEYKIRESVLHPYFPKGAAGYLP